MLLPDAPTTPTTRRARTNHSTTTAPPPPPPPITNPCWTNQTHSPRKWSLKGIVRLCWFLIVLQGYLFVGLNIVLPFTTWIHRQQPTWRLGAGTSSLTTTTTRTRTTTKPKDLKKYSYLIQDEETTTTTGAHNNTTTPTASTTTSSTTPTTSSQKLLPPAKEEEWETTRNHFIDSNRIGPTRTNNQHVGDATRGNGHSTATTTTTVHSLSSLPVTPSSLAANDSVDTTTTTTTTLNPISPTTTTTKIPKIMIFTHQTNLLDPEKADPKAAARYLGNILNTIQFYQQAWTTTGNLQEDEEEDDGVGETFYSSNNNSTRGGDDEYNDSFRGVWFLDNDECTNVLEDIHPYLVHYLHNEPRGDYRGDICRAAALYVTGGYYFDVDLKVLNEQAPVQFPASTTFSSVVMLDGSLSAYFQAFLAASPRNPIVYDSLSIMLRYYAKQDNRTNLLLELRRNQTIRTAGMAVRNMEQFGLIGPFATKAAYENVIRNGRRDHGNKFTPQEPVFLAEQLMDSKERRQKFPDLHYQDDGVGCCCNYLVHDGSRPYFFSRMVGAGPLCEFPNQTNTIATKNNITVAKSTRTTTTTITQTKLATTWSQPGEEAHPTRFVQNSPIPAAIPPPSLWEKIPKDIPWIRYKDLVTLMR